MNNEIIVPLIIMYYIAIGVFVSTIIVSIDRDNDAPPCGLIIFFWPIFLAATAVTFAVLIIPVALGERIVSLIKNRMKD